MLSSAQIKRQIIESAKTGPFRRPHEQPDNPMPPGEVIEIGKALEAVTKMAGWAIISQYMEKQEDIIGLITNDKMSEQERTMKRGIAAAFIRMDQWIVRCIAEKDKILEEERLKHEAKNVQKEEIYEG